MMKVFFISVLVLNFLFESLAGVSLIFGPQGIFSDARPEEGMWAMNYGFAALAMASAIFWIWPGRDDARATGTLLGVLLTFHTLMSISLAIPGDQMAAMAIHGVLAILCIFLFTQRSKWCAARVPG